MKLSEDEIKRRLKSMSMGISNIAEITLKDKTEKRYFGLQFYDLDVKFKKENYDEIEKKIQIISDKLFQNRDLMLFKTKNGIHFVSLMLDLTHSLSYYRRRAGKISKKLEQNYKFKREKYLVLRISPKKKEVIDKFNQKPKMVIVNPRPKFFRLVNKPSSEMMISSEHLKIYNHFIGLPQPILNMYLESKIIKTKAKLHAYRTR